MEITKQQATNYYHYCVLAPERDEIFFALHNNEFLNETIYTKEQACKLARKVAINFHHRDPQIDNSVTFIFHLSYAIKELLVEHYHFDSFKGLDGFYDIVKIVEKERIII